MQCVQPVQHHHATGFLVLQSSESTDTCSYQGESAQLCLEVWLACWADRAVRPGAGAGAASFSRMEDDAGGGPPPSDVTESEGEDAAPEARCLGHMMTMA